VFRVGDAGVPPAQTVPTGFAALDGELAGGGWPRPGLVELLCDAVGVGELSLILPAHRLIDRAGAIGSSSLLWVAPPWLPYAPALEAAGVDLARLMVVKPARTEDALWAAEQALISGTIGLVALWLNDRQGHDVALRRLSQTATLGNALCLLTRPRELASRPSPAQVRICLEAAEHGVLRLDLIKRRSLAPGKHLLLQTRVLACLQRADAPVPAPVRPAVPAWMGVSPAPTPNLHHADTALVHAAAVPVRERSFLIDR
jgi:cell division inhibitor SulA/protein ImuA